MAVRVIPVDPFDLVIFGGTGDLAMRKIFPALFRRALDGQMPPDARIIGAARSDLETTAFRRMVADALRSAIGPDRIDAAALDRFLVGVSYVRLDALGPGGWDDLRAALTDDHVQAFYFSVAPGLFGPLAERLTATGIARPDARIVVEKPFGRDLASARDLNAALAGAFDEAQVYRIDHYLGKETVQNLMAVRFANVLFEPLWNRQFVDHIQITVAEAVGVAGRGEYYDRAGAMRDMVQNHMMQLLCLIAMEPPSRFDPDAVRDEKLKVIRALQPVEDGALVRGQYGAGPDSAGYLAEANIDGSTTESFIAMRLCVSNWRWHGTPFYLQTGKRLDRRRSEIHVVFKDTPHSIFGAGAGHSPNVLSIRLQPDEGITLRVTIKDPGPGGMRLIDVPLDMSFAEALGQEGRDMPDAYERLIMDVIRGDQTLFMRGDEVEAAWAWADPVIAGFAATAPEVYAPGSAGPDGARRLMAEDGRRWMATSDV